VTRARITALTISILVACGDDRDPTANTAPAANTDPTANTDTPDALRAGDSGIDASRRDAQASRDAARHDAAARDAATAARPAPSAGDAAASPVARTDSCPADAPLAVDRVRVYPVRGGGASLRGAQFQGSNEGTTVGFVDLATLTEAPADGRFTELKFDNEIVYRYLRFFDSEGRPAPLAELEFYHGQTRLVGEAFGTVGSSEHPFRAALDDNTDTYYEGETAGGNYIGLDTGGSYVAAAPTFTPPSGVLATATKISLSTATKGAESHFTTDGTTPTRSSPVYSQPIAAGTSKLSIRAVSIAPCYFASPVADATYVKAGSPVGVGQKSFHLGNSLTDTIDGFLKPIADSTGVTHTFARWTIPGCQISWQADSAHNQDGTAEPAESRDVATFVKSYLPDQMTVQPFTDPTIAKEGPAALKFLQPAVAANPNLQAWVYAQWPSTKATQPDTAGRGYLQDELARGASWANWPAPTQPVPDTWEDTTDARMRYYEAFADYVDQRLAGKPVLVIPGGPALATLKRRVDAGSFPGITDFFAQVFNPNDDLHLRNHGRYLVSLVFYACFYRQNPVDKVSYLPDEVSAEQATALKQIAWETASGYPRCGISTP
jgi:Chitobiase/beta-hexosaminidase C-terminal domain